MADRHAVAAHHPFASGYYDAVARWWRRTSRILVVVDGALSIRSAERLGISRVVALLRATSFGWSDFEVTLATRDGRAATRPAAGPEEFTYEGFRFDQTEPDGSPTLDRFHQVWCFAFHPGNAPPNDPNSLAPAIDAVADLPGFHPPSIGELARLTTWMNERGGGVFAAGDHHLLGASMCKDIPRVGSMRRWTVAQGVPTISLPTRVDTTRPGTPAERIGADTIGTDHESDATPQPIEWVPEDRSWTLFGRWERPHALLCHPEHGPIDVLPDHPHEGVCFDPQQVAWIATYANSQYEFNGTTGPVYPDVDGVRPLPKVVAWGRALAGPPLDFEKGDQPARHFPLVTAYDGQLIGIGRVVTDSTWHHWLDMNVAGLTGDDLAKVERYHVNVAIWLASASWRRGMVVGLLEQERFGYFGLQEVTDDADTTSLGRAACTGSRGRRGSTSWATGRSPASGASEIAPRCGWATSASPPCGTWPVPTTTSWPVASARGSDRT